jgi:hypothetical protein
VATAGEAGAIGIRPGLDIAMVILSDITRDGTGTKAVETCYRRKA